MCQYHNRRNRCSYRCRWCSSSSLSSPSADRPLPLSLCSTAQFFRTDPQPCLRSYSSLENKYIQYQHVYKLCLRPISTDGAINRSFLSVCPVVRQGFSYSAQRGSNNDEIELTTYRRIAARRLHNFSNYAVAYVRVKVFWFRWNLRSAAGRPDCWTTNVLKWCPLSHW